MTEKPETFEIHPMKGHSRGEWYATLDDIADSAESAEYWAVFGVTHRGNKHCLGEFATESAAQAAVRGLKHFPQQRAWHKAPRRDVRVLVTGQSIRIVQLEVSQGEDDGSMLELFALCDDGSVWHRGVGIGENRGFMDDAWVEITLDGMGR